MLKTQLQGFTQAHFKIRYITDRINKVERPAFIAEYPDAPFIPGKGYK